MWPCIWLSSRELEQQLEQEAKKPQRSLLNKQGKSHSNGQGQGGAQEVSGQQPAQAAQSVDGCNASGVQSGPSVHSGSPSRTAAATDVVVNVGPGASNEGVDSLRQPLNPNANGSKHGDAHV